MIADEHEAPGTTPAVIDILVPWDNLTRSPDDFPTLQRLVNDFVSPALSRKGARVVDTRQQSGHYATLQKEGALTILRTYVEVPSEMSGTTFAEAVRAGIAEGTRKDKGLRRFVRQSGYSVSRGGDDSSRSTGVSADRTVSMQPLFISVLPPFE